MKKNKILVAIALSVSLSAFSGMVNANSHMAGYDSSVEYSQYRGEKSAYKLRASDLLGADLENAGGESVGEIDDLVVNRKDDQLMAIVSVGGFLGIGDRLVAVPYENLRMGKDSDNVYWDISKSSLEALAEFTYDENETSGYESMMSRRQGTDTDAKRMGYSKSIEYSKFRGDDSRYKLRISELLGEELENADGDNLGEVDDLIIPRNGNSLQAVVSVGGFLGMGDRLILVPHDELRVGADGDEFYLNANKEALESRPEFSYEGGERTGMAMLMERKRYAAEIKEDLIQTKKAAEEAAQKAKQEAKSATAATMTAAGAMAQNFKNSVSYNEVRNDKSPYHLRMSEIIGEDVENANDEEIGEIDDLVMSREDDSLMAIISVGGFLGMGEKLVSVPYKDLRMSADGDDIYLNSTKEMLEARPEFKYNEGESFGKRMLQDRMSSDK